MTIGGAKIQNHPTLTYLGEQGIALLILEQIRVDAKKAPEEIPIAYVNLPTVAQHTLKGIFHSLIAFFIQGCKEIGSD